jgi:DNA replication protein DnaC
MQVHLQMPTVNRTNAINAMNKDTQNTPNTQDAKDTPPHHAAPPEGMNVAQLKKRAKALRLMGLLAHWEALQGDTARLGWTADLLQWEESERSRRSLERRLRSAHIGRFKPLADFDWDWPTHCDRVAVQELMTLSFMADATNVVLVGPNGVGKSMLACNLGHQALIEGRTVLFTTAGQLLGDLAALDSDSALRRRLRHYAAPDLLLIDEVGYLSYSNRHADLLFELISRRYENKVSVRRTHIDDVRRLKSRAAQAASDAVVTRRSDGWAKLAACPSRP